MDNIVDDVKRALELGAHSDTECNVRFVFNPDLALFRGHFPGDPILPGVFQIEMIRAAVEAASGTPHRITLVKSAKFRRPIRPGEVIGLHIALNRTQDAVVAKGTASVGDKVASQITIHLRASSGST